MKINERLKAISEEVLPHSHLIDVGCDHALLGIYLLTETDKQVKVIASDIKEGPLLQAKKNVEKYHLTGQITLKLGNGLAPMEEDTDTIVISGMGGKHMIGIFKYQKEKLFHVSSILLSPNSDVVAVRTYLVRLGYFIVHERLVKDHNFIYYILRFAKGRQHYTKKELYFGPVALKEKDPLFFEYYKKELERKRILLRLLPKKYIVKWYRLKKEIKMIQDMLDS